MTAIKSMRPGISRLAVVLAVGLAASAGGCRHLLDDEVAADLNDPVKRHPVAFAAEPEVLLVELAPGGNGLSANQEADVYRFVRRYKAESTGTLSIDAPRAAGAHLQASRSARQVEAIVRDAGIDPSAVSATRSGPAVRGAPVLRLSYDKTVAVAPQCGDWATDLGENRERLNYNNFGCATQRNFALNVANARDIIVPREESQRSSEVRSASWSKYIGGADSGSKDPASGSAAPATPGAPDPGATP